MRNTLYILIVALLAFPHPAQAQKWMKKVRKAQVNVLTYDAGGQLLRSTNGFLIGKTGTVLSDYAAFKGASKAVVIDEKGKEYAVERICGASSLYDVVKVQVSSIKGEGLHIAQTPVAKGQAVFIMPYLGNKANVATAAPVVNADVFNDKYHYYTLDKSMSVKAASCPVMNDNGEVVGLLQLPAKTDSGKSYVIDASFAAELSITALSATSSDYRDILIQKKLPDEASQANSFIYLIGKRDTTQYLAYIEDYLLRFPESADGYITKGEALTGHGDYAGAIEAWETGLAKAKERLDEIHASKARSIYAKTQNTSTLPSDWTMEHALREAGEAYRINPQPTYTALEAHILYSLHQYAEAARKFQAVCSTNMRSPEQFLYAAQCLSMLEDTLGVLAMQDSAVACFTKPYTDAAATPLLMRSNTLIGLKRYRDAVADLNEYEHLRFNSVNDNFYYQREQCEMKCRMFQQALNDIERAAKMAPDEPLYQAELASVNYRLNQLDEAIAAAKQAIAIAPDFADAYRIIGLSMRAKGKEADARKYLQKAIELGDTIAPSLINP